MSLTREAFNEAGENYVLVNTRVNNLLKTLELPLEDKVQMDHYGRFYLFGKEISDKSTDTELIKIIKKTPKESYNKQIDFSGAWTE